MNEAFYLIGCIALTYIGWRLGYHTKQDTVSSLEEEVREAQRLVKQAEKKSESLLVVNQGLSREMKGMSEVISDHERYIDMMWIYAGEEIKSIGAVRHNGKAYLVMEPSRKGFTPFVVAADNPKLQPRVVA